MKKKAVVTGSAGFIGTHLCHRLEKEEYNVLGLDNNSHPCEQPFPSEFMDIRYPIDRWIADADIVFHLAAQINIDKANEHPEETIDINVNGTANILEICRKNHIKVVYASSSEVYGSAQQQFMNESHPLDSQSIYAATKVAGDRLCKAYIDTYGMDISILRNFNTFGPLQNADSYGGVISIFTKAAKEGKPIRIFGSGEQERDYIWIDDAIEAYMIAAKQSGVINACSGTTIKVNRIAEIIKEEACSASEIIHVDPRPAEVQRLCGDASKIRSMGWKPTISIEGGIRIYVNTVL